MTATGTCPRCRMELAGLRTPVAPGTKRLPSDVRQEEQDDANISGCPQRRAK